MDNRIKEIKELAHTKFLSLYDVEYKNKLGKIRNWTVASRKDFKTLKGQYLNGESEKVDAVIIAALHKESKTIICIKQFRVPLNDYVYELPAGLIDGDEKYYEAAKRELKEETGLDIIDINYEKTREGVYASAGMTDESATITFCTCTGKVSKEGLEEDEDIEVVMMSKEEVRELLKDKKVKIDMRAFILLQAFSIIGEELWAFDN